MSRIAAMNAFAALAAAGGIGISRGHPWTPRAELIDALHDMPPATPYAPPVTNCTAEEASIACQEARKRNVERERLKRADAPQEQDKPK